MAGYIGSQTPVVSNGSQRKYTFTATAAQTVFTGMDIPNPQQIQVFQNGVRLVITTDYTVSSGTTVTLVNAASAGDSLVVILFADYQLLDQDLSGDFSVDSPTFVVDSTNNRVGIGTTSTVAQSKMTIAGNSLSITGFDNGFTSGGNRAMIDFGANYMRLGGLTGGGSTVNGIKFITPAGGDAAILDSDGLKFNGDTAAANALDDYEEGTWTPVINGAGGNPSSPVYGEQLGTYTKVGNTVTVNCVVKIDSLSSNGSGGVLIGGFPFSGKTQNSLFQPSAINIEGLNTALTSNSIIGLLPSSAGSLYLYYNNAATGGMAQITWGTYWVAGSRARFNFTYFV